MSSLYWPYLLADYYHYLGSVRKVLSQAPHSAGQ